MAVVDAPDFPLLGYVLIFHQTAAKACHAAQHIHTCRKKKRFYDNATKRQAKNGLSSPAGGPCLCVSKFIYSHAMKRISPRIFYILAVLAFVLLLSQNPVTLFMAACFSCLTLPLYRRLACNACRKANRREKGFVAARLPLWQRLCLPFNAIHAYVAIICSALLVPVAAVVLLVAPQAAAGLERLRELQANNFQLPAEWVEPIQRFRGLIEEYPQVHKALNDFLASLESAFGDVVGILVSRSFGFLGGTMTVMWTTFLFFTLTVLFSVYAGQIKRVACRIFGLPQAQLRRFVVAERKALGAIMLGIVLVAVAQGFLCGLGFAVAGLKQPAFWGMLAAFVAPIPVVGTALVWLPLCVSLWFTGKTMAATGLALWGVLAVAGIDNVLRPLFLRQGIHAPFFVLILAILCGIVSFGAVGLIAGPVLLAFALQALSEGDRCC